MWSTEGDQSATSILSADTRRTCHRSRPCSRPANDSSAVVVAITSLRPTMATDEPLKLN